MHDDAWAVLVKFEVSVWGGEGRVGMYIPCRGAIAGTAPVNSLVGHQSSVRAVLNRFSEPRCLKIWNGGGEAQGEVPWFKVPMLKRSVRHSSRLAYRKVPPYDVCHGGHKF